MSIIEIDYAIEKLTEALNGLHADDLVEVYNELFPHEPMSHREAQQDVTPLIERIVDHIRRGLEPEEVVDLWSIVFPGNRDVYFDEEDNVLHYETADSAC